MRTELALSFTRIVISVKFVGDDMLIIVEGGDKPHIGTAVLAVPRPSLTDDGSLRWRFPY